MCSFPTLLQWQCHLRFSPPSCHQVPTPAAFRSGFTLCFQGAHAVSCCPVPLWLYNFPTQKCGSPQGARQWSFSHLLSLNSHCPCTTIFYCKWITHLTLFVSISFPCYSFCLSWPPFLISICWNPNRFSRFNSSVCSLHGFPDHSRPLSSILHLFHSYGTYHMLLCIIIFMYVSCLQALCWALYKRNLI